MCADILPFCQTRVSCDAHFATYACYAMIILPYTHIPRYQYAASTQNTEGGRAQRSLGSISMVQRHWTPQRPVFSLGVSQYMYKITDHWKFWLKLSSKLWKNKERKHSLCTNLCAFRYLKWASVCWLQAWSLLYLREKLPLSQKLHCFLGSCFSQCFTLSTALHCSLPSQFLSWHLFWVNTNSVQCL